MIKRVNFTGRRRIPRDRIDISVYDGHPRTFDANIDLDGLPLLPHAAVFLEASCAGSTVVERFSFGEVGKIRPPHSRALKELEGVNVFFTLKVVDQTEEFGRIIGIAEYIRPQRAGKQTVAGRRGILPVEPADLGQQLWKLAFREQDVFFLVNKNIPGLVDRVRCDPMFYAVVYPEIVRQVLFKAIAENVDLEEEGDRWPILWLRFGTELLPVREPPPKCDDPEEDQEAWIEEVVKAFCETHSLKDKFIAASGRNESIA